MERTCEKDACPTTLGQQDIYDKRKNASLFESIDYIADLITYEEFFVRYLVANKPCILGPKVTQLWKSRSEWVTKDGKPSFEFLKTRFGDATIPVAVCNEQQYDSHPKIERKFTDYIDYWQDYISHGYPSSSQCLYLKDWHFTRAFPEYEAYVTPLYFCSDWLNEFWDNGQTQLDDYRFVYMGPKGSWTPFHADVFHSYSWSANICGQKRWLLFPPGEEDCLRDKFGNLVFDATSSDLQDSAMYPKYSELKQQYEVIQNIGEIIFVPSGWHHQVWNTEDTISINHNWLNGCCIDLNWKYLKRNLLDIEKEISDCSDMEGWNQQCQTIMKSLVGIDYAEFLQLCDIIATKRVHYLKGLSNSSHCDRKEIADREPSEDKVIDSEANQQKHVESTHTEDSDQISTDRIQNKGPCCQLSNQHFSPMYNKCHSVFDLLRLKVVIDNMLVTDEFELKDDLKDFFQELNSVL